MLFELLLRSWSIILIAILKQGTRASGNFLITYIISLQCEDIDAKQDCIFQDHFKAVHLKTCNNDVTLKVFYKLRKFHLKPTCSNRL